MFQKKASNNIFIIKSQNLNIRKGVKVLGVYLPQYPSGHFSLSSLWHVCPDMCFSRTTCSLSRYNVKGESDYFNWKTGFFLRLFTSMFTKESNCDPRFCEKINSSIGNI